MTRSEINKYITEKVLGECWHDSDGDVGDIYAHCSKCGLFDPPIYERPNFSQWKHYGPMIRKCMEKE